MLRRKKIEKMRLEAKIEKGVTFNLPASTPLRLKGARSGGENQPLVEYAGSGLSVIPMVKGDGKKVVCIATDTTLGAVLKFHKADKVKIFIDTGVVATKI